MVTIDTSKCTGCGGCIDLCPVIAISMINRIILLNIATTTLHEARLEAPGRNTQQLSDHLNETAGWSSAVSKAIRSALTNGSWLTTLSASSLVTALTMIMPP